MKENFNIESIDFDKNNGLVPVVIQHADNLQVLMVGYMNKEALKKTLTDKMVTFFSRSKNRLWTKGETSGNFLNVQNIAADCDNDALLIKVLPIGPTCHTGKNSCFFKPVTETASIDEAKGFLYDLERTISDRINSKDSHSYTYKLYQRGINKVAQKVGEEAVETVIEAKDNNSELFKNEVADLLYHLLILLYAKDFKLLDIEAILKTRMK